MQVRFEELGVAPGPGGDIGRGERFPRDAHGFEETEAGGVPGMHGRVGDPDGRAEGEAGKGDMEPGGADCFGCAEFVEGGDRAGPLFFDGPAARDGLREATPGPIVSTE